MNKPYSDKNISASDLPNGPVAAAFLAGGIGSAVLGLMTLLAEASASIAKTLTWAPAVGPLSGKTGLCVIAFFVSWIILHFALRGKNVNFNRYALISFVLLAIGLLFTFPPFFMLFAAE